MLMGCFNRVPLEIALDVRAGHRTSLPVRRSGGTGLGCRRVPLLLVVTEGSAGEGVLRVEAVCNCEHCELCANVPFRRVGCPFTRWCDSSMATCTNVTRVVNITPVRLLSQDVFQNVKDITANHFAWPA